MATSAISRAELKSPHGEEALAGLCKNLANAAGPKSPPDYWLSFVKGTQPDRDVVSVSSRLQILDTYLLARATMLNTGTTLGIADVAMYLSIHDEVAAMAPEDRLAYPNLLRWIDYVQDKDDKSHALSWIEVQKPKFDPPAPSAEVKKLGLALQGASEKGKTPPVAAGKPQAEQKPAAVVEEKNRLPEPSAGNGKAERLVDKKGKSPGVVEAKNGKPEPAGQPDGKKGKAKESKAAAPAAAAAPPQDGGNGLEILDIKVGVIKYVKKHPTADTLYVEEIDVGEGSLRQVVSGLAKYLTEDQMLERKVLVLANVKPSKLRDVMSSGLVLCTSNDDHSQCEPVIPPKEAKIGERVTAEGYDGKPEGVLNPKKKQWDKIYPDLHTDEAGVACYKGKPLMSSAGPCTSSIKKGSIK